ncbi:MAG: thioredoxin [Candidatus Scalindua sp.]|nr:thioredoxin [Candidatus Scalindua sp.]
MAGIEAAVNTDFEQIVIQSAMPVLVDFYTDWCVPCKAQTPILAELSGIYDRRIKFVKVDIDVEGNEELATKYGVVSVPTLILFDQGEIVDTFTGMTSKSILEQKFRKILLEQ